MSKVARIVADFYASCYREIVTKRTLSLGRIGIM